MGKVLLMCVVLTVLLGCTKKEELPLPVVEGDSANLSISMRDGAVSISGNVGGSELKISQEHVGGVGSNLVVVGNDVSVVESKNGAVLNVSVNVDNEGGSNE